MSEEYDITMSAKITGETYQLTVTGFPSPEEAEGFKRWLFKIIRDAQDGAVADFRSLGRAH